MPHIGVIEEISRRGAEELCVEWQIPNFPSLVDGRDDCYLSPAFRFGDVSWQLWMQPNRKRERLNPASEWMRLDLSRRDGGPAATFRFSVGIRGSRGLEKSREGEKEFEAYDCYEWEDFCSRSYLLEHRARLMPEDTFTIRCVLRRPGAATDTSTPTVEEGKEDEVPTEENSSLEKQGGEKALEDFGTLLESGENSDVTVQVGDVEFKVHSLILFARSPALSVSLRHDSKEKASSKILIEDTEPGAFREYLQYLYTGSVRSVTEQNVFHLYRLADKYLAQDLKLQCLKHVGNTLSVQTFCDTIKLALTHGESELLERALDFAKENIQLIIVSVEWQNFICEHPREANEILVKCFGPRS